MAIKVFISHAAADKILASALVDFLMSSLSLDEADIRCTSVPGHKLFVGSESATTIREELGESTVVVGLITKTAISSSWVLFELGATWGARKKLKPLVSDEVSFKELPGPLSGHHAAKLSSKSDLSQFVDEVASIVATKMRSRAKVDAAIDKLMNVHQEHLKTAAMRSKPSTIVTKAKEPTIGGIPFSEMVSILQSEKLTVPAKLIGKKEDVQLSLFEAFMGNYQALANGLHSNWDSDSAGGYLYHEVGLRLMPYNLMKFDKLPAGQAKWFKRLILSDEGHKLVAHYKRLSAAAK
jgi:hypothetical protein